MLDGLSERGDDNTAKAHERRRLLRRLAIVAAGVLLVLVVVVVVVLPPRFTAHRTFDKDYEELKAQNDVRTTLLQGLGALLVLTGAAIGASVAYRGVQETRRQIAQTAADNQEQFTLTRQGQITDRYTKAVEQLGHEKAPVRLGALYSLEHLAQDNPQYRQTVVDVVCAYLRMSYTLQAQTGLDAEQWRRCRPPPMAGTNHRIQRQDGILSGRSSRFATPPSASPGRSFRSARPPSASSPTTLPTPVAALCGPLAGMLSSLNPRPSRPSGQASASTSPAPPSSTSTSRGVSVIQARLVGATFQGPVNFGASFHYPRPAGFARAIQGVGVFDGAHVLHLDNRDGDRWPDRWPDGWTIDPDPTDPTRGFLVRAEGVEEPPEPPDWAVRAVGARTRREKGGGGPDRMRHR